MFRKILAICRHLAKRVEAQKSSWIWRHRKSPTATLNPYIANILVTKNPIYAKVARVCVESFLYHHPNSKVNLHVDEITKKEVENEILSKFPRARVSVFTVNSNERSWQEQKISLILSLNGTTELFMDADLRWNSGIQSIKSVTFYVDEFPFLEKSPYRQLIKIFRNGEYSNSIMKNTSFFTFHGNHISKELNLDVYRIEQELLELIKSDILGALDRDQVTRLSEQIALSIASTDWNYQIDTLKNTDGHKDGAFVESSYFGATGSTF